VLGYSVCASCGFGTERNFVLNTRHLIFQRFESVELELNLDPRLWIG